MEIVENNVVKKKDELPELLEFLKMSRVLIREMKLFDIVEIPKESVEVLQKASTKLKNETEKFLQNIEEKCRKEQGV